MSQPLKMNIGNRGITVETHHKRDYSEAILFVIMIGLAFEGWILLGLFS
jgi:hypothetical protein